MAERMELTRPVFFVGFMGAGKTSVARRLARTCGVASVDMDTYIERREGKKVKEIFAEGGEEGFRAIETDVLRELGAKPDPLLISCGGGIVKRPENLWALHQNGVILFIDRPVDALAVGGGRPLSSSMDALRQMEAQRRPLYLAAADAVIPNNGTLDEALHAAMEALDEIFDS